MTQFELEQLRKQFHIPEMGATSWPLPAVSEEHLTTPYPCPFTNGSVEERIHKGTALQSPKSAIVALFPYYVPWQGNSNLARYCWSADYHIVVRSYLERVVAYLQEQYTQEEFEIHCDTSPLADRYMAYLSGLGFYGLNQTLIHPTWGSYTVIGTILTSLKVEPNEPMTQTCIGCGACLQKCPGQALTGQHLNYETCKSYLTQCKGDLTTEEERIIQQSPLLFGCDVCQEVCPHNHHIPTTPIPEFLHIEPYVDVQSLASLTNKEFKALYGHKAWAWRGKKIILRNDDIIRKAQL